jgi:predicted phage terminase large subunit-like protein
MQFSDEKAYLAAVRLDLYAFLWHAFKTLYPGKELLDNWHLNAIVHSLELSIEGKKPRLIINLPPRYLKSFITSVVLPAFILGQDPSAKIICISYSDDLAKTLARDFKRIVESAWYPRLFPHVRPIKTTENEFVTDQGGFRYATSVGGTLTGRGGDFIIIDDPIKPEEANSDSTRKKVNEWFQSTLFSRLDDKKHSVMIIVMQRLHVNDLTGFAQESGGFKKLSFPAIATGDEFIPVSATETYHRKDGEPLHAEYEDLNTLERIRNQIDTHNFVSQYQQSPETPSGVFIKREYIQIIDHYPKFGPEGHWWVSIDSALSTSETADYSALTLGYSNRDGHFVLNVERGRWDYETLRGKASSYVHRVHRVGGDVIFIVEAAGSGISLIEYMRKAQLRCFHHHAKHDKVVRASRVLPLFADGRVHICKLKSHNGWVEAFINELLTFPNGRHDDQVDSLVQALRWAEPRVNPGGRCYLVEQFLG